MTEQYFVVEGVFDRILLEKILPPEFVSKTKFIMGEEHNAAISKARSILVASERPVYILLNSDTTDPYLADEKKDYADQMLRQVSASDRFKILLSIPETEILLFHDKSVFESLFSIKVGEQQWNYAKSEPRRTLSELLNNSDVDHILDILNNRLTDDLLEKLRKNEIIQNIISAN